MFEDNQRPAPNYINSCIVLFGVNITWILVVIWTFWGLLIAMLVSAVINATMTRLHNRAQYLAAEQRRAPKARARW